MAVWIYIYDKKPEGSLTSYKTLTGKFTGLFPYYKNSLDTLVNSSPSTLLYYRYGKANSNWGPIDPNYWGSLSVSTGSLFNYTNEGNYPHNEKITNKLVIPNKLVRDERDNSNLEDYGTIYQDFPISGKHILSKSADFPNGALIPVRFTMNGTVYDGIGNYTGLSNGYSILADTTEMIPRAIQRGGEDLNTLTFSDIASDTVLDFGTDVQYVPELLLNCFDIQILKVYSYDTGNLLNKFTMPAGYSFKDFVNSDYNTSNGKFVLENDNPQVFYNAYALFKNDNTLIQNTDIAEGDFYYVPNITFDLSTLGLEAGTHEITVSAKASGYADSAKSNAVSYVIEVETYELSGTWRFNETLTFTEGLTVSEDVTFSSYTNSTDGVTTYFKKMVFVDNGNYFDVRYVSNSTGRAIPVYESVGSGWPSFATDDTRVVNFGSTPQIVSKDFYDWFTANAKRLVSPPPA